GVTDKFIGPALATLRSWSQPPRHAPVVRARPPPAPAEAVRPVPALRRRSGRRAVGVPRRGHPFAPRIAVAPPLPLGRGRGREVALGHVASLAAEGDLAPSVLAFGNLQRGRTGDLGEDLAGDPGQ